MTTLTLIIIIIATLTLAIWFLKSYAILSHHENAVTADHRISKLGSVTNVVLFALSIISAFFINGSFGYEPLGFTTSQNSAILQVKSQPKTTKLLAFSSQGRDQFRPIRDTDTFTLVSIPNNTNYVWDSIGFILETIQHLGSLTTPNFNNPSNFGLKLSPYQLDLSNYQKAAQQWKSRKPQQYLASLTAYKAKVDPTSSKPLLTFEPAFQKALFLNAGSLTLQITYGDSIIPTNKYTKPLSPAETIPTNFNYGSICPPACDLHVMKSK